MGFKARSFCIGSGAPAIGEIVVFPVFHIRVPLAVSSSDRQNSLRARLNDRDELCDDAVSRKASIAPGVPQTAAAASTHRSPFGRLFRNAVTNSAASGGMIVLP